MGPFTLPLEFTQEDMGDRVLFTVRQRFNPVEIQRAAREVVEWPDYRRQLITPLVAKMEQEAGWALLTAAIARIDELEAELSQLRAAGDSPSLGGFRAQMGE